MIRYINCIAFLVLSLQMSSCKEGGCNTILNNISFRTTLNPQQASQVSVQNGWTYADGGKCGLLIYNSGDRIVAYERCIARQKSVLIADGFVGVDQESGAKWLLKDGSPVHIAECPLQSYSVKREGNLIIISN